MNWYRQIKIASISGEFWITEDGNALEASGMGDMNHEAYVIDTARNQLADSDDYEGWKRETALEVLGEKQAELEDQKMETEDPALEKQIDAALYEIWEMQQNIDYHAYEIIWENREALGIDGALFDIAEQQGDPRVFAMQQWGWKRLVDEDVETWNLTSGDMKAIAGGLWDAYQDDAELAEFNVYIYSTKKWYNDVPFDVLDKGNPAAFREFDSLMV